MKTIEIISQDVFDKIRSRFSNLQMGDEEGAVTMDPRMARFFDFDFVIEGNNLGRVSISINELGTLKVFYGKSLLEDVDSISRDFWYDFLREMRMFAKRRLLRFDTRDITKSNLNKDDFQYLAANGPKDETMNMSESAKFQGGKKTSYRVLEKTKLIAKHRSSIEDESYGARSRANNIKALYIENEDGERFKYPFIHIAGAKAMQQHCAHGGRPYDDRGQAIIKMSEQIAQLSSFKRHLGSHDGMNQAVNEIAGRASSKLESLRNSINSLGRRQGYEAWAESFEPTTTMQGTVEMDAATMEDYKSKFSVTSFKEDLAQYFPLLHSIMQETGTIDLEDYVSEGDDETCNECGMIESKCSCDDEVKENYFTKFTEWADALSEGRIEPDTLASLQELMSGELQLGVDGTVAIEALQGIGIHDEELENALMELSKVSPEADPKATIGAWLQKEDPEAAAEFGLAPTPSSAAVVPQQQGTVNDPMAEEQMDEGVEDNTSYQVARYLFDKGLRYKPANEKEIIKMIGGAMMKMGMDHKQVRYLMSYDEDFLPDTLSELKHMEAALDERGVAEGADMDQIPAYIRKQKQQSQQAGDAATAQRNQAAGAKVWKNPRSANADVEKELNDGSVKKVSMKELAEWVAGHYNQNYAEEGFKSGFRKGPTELGVMAKKQFGEEYGDIVERMVSDMDDTPLQRITRKGDKRRNEAEEIQGHHSSPLTDVDNPRFPKGPEEAYNPNSSAAQHARDMKQHDHDRLKAAAEKDGASDQDKARYKKYQDREAAKKAAYYDRLNNEGVEANENTDFDRILKLAGLVK